MANRPQHKGPCYLCGHETSKGYMGRHLLSQHLNMEAVQQCYLLKIEDEYSDYWLFIDIPVTSTLSTLDTFLRAVWLECCGHMSSFMAPNSYGNEYGMSRKIGAFKEGSIIQYDYDFGSTTTLYITFLKKTTRTQQKNAVRVLARNAPYDIKCNKCSKPAEFIDPESWPADFYCAKCAKKCADHEIFLPVVNSPRMGVCAYCGEYDKYQYVPVKKA